MIIIITFWGEGGLVLGNFPLGKKKKLSSRWTSFCFQICTCRFYFFIRGSLCSILFFRRSVSVCVRVYFYFLL